MYDLAGKRLSRVGADFVGAARVSAKREHSWFFAQLIGFTNPGIVARYDFMEKVEAARWSVYRKTVVTGLSSDDFEAKQVSIWACAGRTHVLTKLPFRCGSRARTVRRCRCSSYGIRTRSSTEQHLPSSTVSPPSFSVPRPRPYAMPCKGYGGFAIAVSPFWSSSIMTFMQKYGVVLAVPNIRGGSEFGEEWHLAGTRENKVRRCVPSSAR